MSFFVLIPVALATSITNITELPTETLFYDDFSNPSFTNEQWDLQDPWFVKDGKLSAVTGDHVLALVKGLTIDEDDEVIVSGRMELESCFSDQKGGFILKYTEPPSNFYSSKSDHHWYGTENYAFGLATYLFRTDANWVAKYPEAGGFPFIGSSQKLCGQFWDFAFYFHDCQIDKYFDGVPFASLEDCSVKSGRVGFYNFNQLINVENFRVERVLKPGDGNNAKSDGGNSAKSAGGNDATPPLTAVKPSNAPPAEKSIDQMVLFAAGVVVFLPIFFVCLLIIFRTSSKSDSSRHHHLEEGFTTGNGDSRVKYQADGIHTHDGPRRMSTRL